VTVDTVIIETEEVCRYPECRMAAVFRMEIDTTGTEHGLSDVRAFTDP
jgi:hypothetical protein